MDKLFTLRSKIAGHSRAQQVRSVSQRSITDLEMNSTYRGAVEVFNLCRHLKMGDVLYAEMDKYIPVTRKPNVRTDRSVANDTDIYGLRPLKQPWLLLSPYEFLRYWKAEPLLAPSYYSSRNMPVRTRWTADGKQIAMSDEYKDGKVTLKPGLHFVIVEPEADAEYAAFPSEPAHIFSPFRHSWVLVRKGRPDVVVIESLKMPRASRAAAENEKYCSLFFRPWTLLGGSPQVPHLSFLALPHNILKQFHAKSDSSVVRDHAASLQDFVSWERTWDVYVPGNVVIEAAANLIRSFSGDMCQYV